MTLLPKTGLAQTAALLAVLGTPVPSANACTCSFSHDWGFVGPEIGRLPANAVGVAWYAPQRQDPKELERRLSVEILEGSGFRVLPVRVSIVEEFSTESSGMYLVAPKGVELTPGATYRLTDNRADWNGLGHKQVLVTIDREILSAKTSFSLDVGPVTIEVIHVAAAALCFDILFVAQTRINGNLPQNAQLWRENLLYRTIVDEDYHWRPRTDLCMPVVPGRNWESVGQDRIFASCEGLPHPYFMPPVLKPRQLSVMMQAVLPGTGIVLKTPVKIVDLRCPTWSARVHVDRENRGFPRPLAPEVNDPDFFRRLPQPLQSVVQ